MEHDNGLELVWRGLQDEYNVVSVLRNLRVAVAIRLQRCSSVSRICLSWSENFHVDCALTAQLVVIAAPGLKAFVCAASERQFAVADVRHALAPEFDGALEPLWKLDRSALVNARASEDQAALVTGGGAGSGKGTVYKPER